MSEFTKGELSTAPRDDKDLNFGDYDLMLDGAWIGRLFKTRAKRHAKELVRRWNEWSDLKQQRDDLLATVKNALISLAVISMPREDNNVATNSEILKIMGDSFIVAIAKAKV